MLIHYNSHGCHSPGGRRLIFWALLLLLGITLLPGQGRGEKYAGTPITQKDAKGQVKRYKTALGELKASWLLLYGSQLTRAGTRMEFKEAYFAIDATGGVSITNPVLIYKGTPYERLTPLVITLVQDRASQDWLATNGLLYVRRQLAYLLEGQQVRVVGGKDNPLMIAGQPFADTTLVIVNGRPVKKER